MGFGKVRGRKTRREDILSFNAAHAFYAAAADKTPQLQHVPPKRERVVRPVDGKPAMPLEREVLASVLQALRADPRVAIVNRQQSGLFQDGNRFIRVGTPGLLDINGMLKGGRYFEIEVKRHVQTRPEPHQQERIDLVKRAGGISGYCWSIESALALLPS